MNETDSSFSLMNLNESSTNCILSSILIWYYYFSEDIKVKQSSQIVAERAGGEDEAKIPR